MTRTRYTRRSMLGGIGALIAGAIFRTNDGETWEKVGIADTNDNVYGVDADGFDDVWVSGGGAVYDLTDGTWDRETTPTGQNLTAVVRGSPDIAVGAGGAMIER